MYKRQQEHWLAENGADCVFGVNHHYPAGDVPQVIYHLNVLRFEREKKPFWTGGEVSDRLRDWRARISLEKAQANLFESEMLRGIAEKTLPEIREPQVVYIGLDDRSPASKTKVGEHLGPLILAVTSEAPHKDNATLIRIVSELKSRRSDANWHLKIAGGDREGFADLKALATDLGIAERIEYLGFVDHDHLQQLGKQAHCLVTTSLVESFCMVALEAMSWGCPVVVTNVSSMPESVGEAGLLAKPSDPADFAIQVLKLWEDQRLRETMIARGYKRAALMTWTNAARSVEAVFRDVIAQAGTRARTG